MECGGKAERDAALVGAFGLIKGHCRPIAVDSAAILRGFA
jgi:hypothetical protein